MDTPTIRGTTRSDLLALPAVMLGFHPQDSCVVLALQGASVRFCVRLDNDWFVADFDAIVDQLLQAADHAGATGFVLVGFGDADLASISLGQLIDVLGVAAVSEALVTDGRRYWSLLESGEPAEYSFETSAVAAQAVYQGVSVSRDREEALLPVTGSSPASAEEVAATEAAAMAMTAAGAMDSLAGLMEAQRSTRQEALLLGVLVADDERFAAVVARLKTGTAQHYWNRLVEARAVCPHEYEPNVLALLGLASWLCGKGAAHTSCLEQLAARAERHPLLGLLHRVHREGVPPRSWDG